METLEFLFFLSTSSANIWAIRVGRFGATAQHNHAFTYGLAGLVMLSASLFCTLFWAASAMFMELSKPGSSYASPVGITMFVAMTLTFAVTVAAVAAASRCHRAKRPAVA